MIRSTLEQSRIALSARLNGDSAASEIAFEGVSIDTRTLKPGEMYVAIVGENFDGHDFAAKAEQSGAAALLVSRPVDSTLPQLHVADTRLALADLARNWRSQHHVPVIGVTGSNGKTTVKELISAILLQCGHVLSTKGNLNNELGVPLTLLRLDAQHDFAVIEMGANHAGEIANLANIAQPDIGVITSIGGVHLEGFGSIEGVVRAKTELFEALPPAGCALVNRDDVYSEQLGQAASHCRQISFGHDPASDVRGGTGSGLNIRIGDEELTVDFCLLGAHNRLNALAAAAVAISLEIPLPAIKAGLESIQPVPGRLVSRAGHNGATVIDDSYNANPVSACAAIDVLAEHSGKRHFALGDMAELGVDAATLHEEVGEHAALSGVYGFWAVGPLAGKAHSRFVRIANSEVTGGHFDSHEALINTLRPQMDADCTVLVKGSRSAQMEQVVDALVMGGGA